MQVKEVGYQIFADQEQTGVQYKLKADAACAVVNSVFQGDIVIPEEIVLVEEAKQKYGVDAIKVQEVHLVSIGRTNHICIQISKNVKDIIIEKDCNTAKLGFIVADDNERYCSEEFCLYNKNRTELIRYYSEDHNSIELPSSIDSIRKGAFSALWIDKLILPIGIEKVSFEDLGAMSIKEVICQGHINEVIGTPFSSTPHILKINSHMGDVCWGKYNIYDNKQSSRPRCVISLFPNIDPTHEVKGVICLHAVPSIQEAIDNHIDYKFLNIHLEPDVEKIIVNEDNVQIDITTRHEWIKEIMDYDYESYNGMHKIAAISFDTLDMGFKVFESAGEVLRLISRGIC